MARTITYATERLHREWNALFDKNPNFEGLESSGTCRSVFCCPDDDGSLDWVDLSDLRELLWLSGAPEPRVLRRNSIDATDPKGETGNSGHRDAKANRNTR